MLLIGSAAATPDQREIPVEHEALERLRDGLSAGLSMRSNCESAGAVLTTPLLRLNERQGGYVRGQWRLGWTGSNDLERLVWSFNLFDGPL